MKRKTLYSLAAILAANNLGIALTLRLNSNDPPQILQTFTDRQQCEDERILTYRRGPFELTSIAQLTCEAI